MAKTKFIVVAGEDIDNYVHFDTYDQALQAAKSDIIESSESEAIVCEIVAKVEEPPARQPVVTKFK